MSRNGKPALIKSQEKNIKKQLFTELMSYCAIFLTACNYSVAWGQRKSAE
jgi:hypothetical protein